MDFCVIFFCGFLGAPLPLNERPKIHREIHSKIHDKIPAKSTHAVKNGVGKPTLQEEGPEIFPLRQTITIAEKSRHLAHSVLNFWKKSTRFHMPNRCHLKEASHIKSSQPHFAFSVFSCPHLPPFPRFCSVESPQTLVFLGWENLPQFPHIVFESLISKIRPTDCIITGLRWPGPKVLAPLFSAPDEGWPALTIVAIVVQIRNATSDIFVYMWALPLLNDSGPFFLTTRFRPPPNRLNRFSLCYALCSTEQRRCPEKRRKGWPAGGKKEKRAREKRSGKNLDRAFTDLLPPFCAPHPFAAAKLHD